MFAVRTLSLSSIAAAIASAVLAPVAITTPTPALAQSGSRLCGWTTDVPAKGMAMGILYEVRTADKSDGKQCSTVIDKVQKKIAADPTLSQLTWTKVEKATCESVGEKFKSTDHTNGDMCDYMQAKTPYTVTKSTKADKSSTTSYDKVDV